MKILLLGGTHFLGRHLAEEALDRGHDVTLFHRGKTNRGLFPQAETLLGDRDGGLAPLKGRQWDAVIDTCGYVPRIVKQSVRLLSDAAPVYAFISTISVYADLSKAGIDEDSALHPPPKPATEKVDAASYGPLKVQCEQAVSAFPGQGLIVRAGLIVGPHDPTDRFTYWPVRVARGGRLAAPGDPKAPVQIVDARDLARWTVARVEAGDGGTYNVTGPRRTLRMGKLLDACLSVSGGKAILEWIPDDVLLAKDIGAFSEMPLWVPSGGEMAGLMQIDCTKAFGAGLKFRPLEETVRDTLLWHKTRAIAKTLAAGLSPDREAELLAAAARK